LAGFFLFGAALVADLNRPVRHIPTKGGMWSQEPRDYRLKEWKSWFGHRVAWSLTEDELFGALEALSAAGLAPSRRQKHVQTKANWIAWATQKSLSS